VNCIRPNLLLNRTLCALPDSPTICPSWIWVTLSLNSGVLMSPCLKSRILLVTTKKPHAYGVYHHLNPHSVHLTSCAAKQSEAHTLRRCQIFPHFELFTHALARPLHSLTQPGCTNPHKRRTHTHIYTSITGDIIPRGNKIAHIKALVSQHCKH
jgi:hypothetical protein